MKAKNYTRKHERVLRQTSAEPVAEKTAEQGGTPIRYYFENLKISIPQIKLSVFTSNKLPLDLKVSCSPGKF